MDKLSALLSVCVFAFVAVLPVSALGQAEECKTISSGTVTAAKLPSSAEKEGSLMIELDDLGCDVIDFEGIGNNSPIGMIPGGVTIMFGSSWLGLIDADAGGNGNFANEPSPSTAAYFLDTNDISIGLAPAVQLVEFYYTAAAISLPIRVTARDADGNLVDEATGSLVGTDYDGAPCGGDPNGAYCRWGLISLASTLNNIHSIVIEGTVANYFGIDNLRVCVGECEVPGDGDPKPYIFPGDNEYSCPPKDVGADCLEHRDFNGDSKADCLIREATSDPGERFEMWCIAGSPNSAFQLFYTPPGGWPGEVVPPVMGMCHFPYGDNRWVLLHSGDNDDDGTVDCFIRSVWTSLDPCDEDGDGLFDWKRYTYNVVSNILSIVDYKTEEPPYSTSCPAPATTRVASTSTEMPLGSRTDAYFDSLFARLQEYPPSGPMTVQVSPEMAAVMPNVLFESTDLPVGELTEAYFDSLFALLQDHPGPVRMTMNRSPLCDLDRNGVCDTRDVEILEASFEKCLGDVDFNPVGDVDGDGCITVVDRAILFPPVVGATVDIEPATLNLKSKGRFMTCYIELPEGYDPVNIFVPSVALNGVIHAELRPSTVGDYDFDGIQDRMVKFSRRELVALLGSADDGEVELTVTGTLADGTPFEGGDIIRVIKPGKNDDGMGLLQVSPMPLSGTARISFELDVEGQVSLRIYDVAGRLLRTLVDERKGPGRHETTWDRKNDDGRRVSAGVYFLRLERQGEVILEKLMVVR